MKDRINVAELLRDCPKGMELDCTIYENTYFGGLSEDESDEYPITVNIIDGNNNKHNAYLTKEGCWSTHLHAKCVIFPKGKTTWEGFVPPCQFKDGDVLFVDCSDDEDKSYQYIFISNDPKKYGKWHSYCHLGGTGHFYSRKTYLTDDEYNPRFATEEEKAKLFQAIKDNGYRWNAETKTLEKLPKFKVGDKITFKCEKDKPIISITGVKDNYYFVQYFNITKNDYQNEKISFEFQDNYELVPNKFDITTLKPFDKVLMRSSNTREWVATFYSHYSNNKFYGCGMCCDQCIPFVGNEHLLGTNDDCDKYFKSWE